MKLPFLKYAYYFTFLGLLFTGCQTSKPAYLFAETAGNYPPQTRTLTSEKSPATSTPTPELKPKTVAIPEEKVLYAANTTQPVAFSAASSTSEQNQFSARLQVSGKPEKMVSEKRYDEPEKVRSRALSGVFLAAGTILLLVALGLVIAGVSGAGIVAWVGGGLFLTGFIFSMVALLGR
ncbi:hypothetical protein I5M27_09735 [Adhaeribacter sp. BT258]|uniref:Uncharacterized protein n=1 Tax=Adhaeribacter terrigena TaxID=2793070 RepID=A0ABS1C276_9BACT|nr:hypothetical protein [Adhaeribacter terrigena]MBK0403266.1 hypothetical protein [Adhaeribacter terrigena]